MAATELVIAGGLSLPLDAVTQAIGIVAKRRVGKSYTARRFAEQLLEAGQQVVIADPKGDWWGIRSSASGKGAGYVADRGLLPNAALFPDVKPWETYRAMKAALATDALKDLPQSYRVHDHRHTWAVQAVRDGLALHTIAHQLGHRDATMVLKVYGRFVPTKADFDRSATFTATAPDQARGAK